jgi:hypothetical protein
MKKRHEPEGPRIILVCYPAGIAEHVTAERLERFFVKQDTTYQVKKALRELCIFIDAQLHQGPAVLAAGPSLLPQCADLPEADSAAEAAAAVPLRCAAQRLSLPRVVRDLQWS